MVIVERDNKKIKICNQILRTICKHIQLQSSDAEAGGIIVGRENRGNNNVVLEYSTEPMKNDVRTRTRYLRKDSGHVEYYKQLYNENLKKINPEGTEVYDEDEGYYLVVNSQNNFDGEKVIYNKKGKAVYKYTAKSNYWDFTEYGDEFEQTYVVLEIDDSNYTIINPDNGKVIAENLNYDSVWADEYTDFCLYDGDDCSQYLIVWNDKVVKHYDYEIDIIFYGSDKNNGYYKIYDDSYGSSNKHDVEYFDLKTAQFSSEQPSGTSDSADIDDLSEWEITTGSTIFSCSAGYGLMINKTQAIPCEYDHIRTPDVITYEYLKSKGKNYVIGNKGDKSYILQAKNGKVVKELDTKYLDFELLSSFVGDETEDDKYHVYNLVTKKDAVFEADDINYNPMYIEVEKSDGKVEYYNKNLKLFYTKE